jgi:hypothetical protein
MLNKQIASIFLLLALAGQVYADTCPDSAEIEAGYNGVFSTKDSSGRIWKGENQGIETADINLSDFESATYIDMDEDETGPISVSQLSCRYKNIAFVLEVPGWKPEEPRRWNNKHCTTSISDCSFTITNK